MTKITSQKSEATSMMPTLSGAKQRPLARSPVDRRQSIAEITAGMTRCFGPDLMPF